MIKRAILFVLVLGGLVAPAFAQDARPERANEPLQQIIPDQFADDGEYDGEDWGEEWGEDPFGGENDARWHEAEEEQAPAEHHFDAQQFFAQAVNFVLWLAIVIYLARGPVTEFLKNRRLSVEEGLVEARQLKEAAEAKYADYSERLERLDEELEKLRTEMVQAGEAERDRIIDDAEARAARMRADAKFVIEQQMKQLRADLTREAIEAAVGAAEKVLTEKIQEADQTRLAQDYLDGLESSMKDEVQA
ncbi:MAG: ATP synthase F0 subunit B [Sandaracinaceae bacterium]